MKALSAVSFLFVLSAVNGQFNPNYAPGRNVMVHLFEWKWGDIAAECERFLGPNGYAGVQVSPPTENAVIGWRPWFERYQPVSYQIKTRSGDENAFRDMCNRCNKAGVKIYADVVFNHMSATPGTGVGGSQSNPGGPNFPGVPYGPNDFNKDCSITNYNDPWQVRNCRLVGMPDLNQGSSYVRDRIVDLLNHLIDLGVSGFRVDAVKHMYPEDLQVIFGRLKNLPGGGRPFIAQEVIDLGGEPIKASHYTHLGTVTEFRFSAEIGRVFRGHDRLSYLKNFGEGWGFLPSHLGFTFIDNHDNQRGHGAGGANVLTYKNSRQYKMATAFHLAWNYGVKRIMSSFDFNDGDQGPPADGNGNLISPNINAEGACTNGWVCEHRWRQIFNMVKFSNAALGTAVNDWWDNGNNQIAFGRGDKGFIVFNGEGGSLDVTLQTGMAQGTYCDIISGDKVGNSCTGASVTIDGGRKGRFFLAGNAYDGVLAIANWSKL